jgi:hypothetical protein
MKGLGLLVLCILLASSVHAVTVGNPSFGGCVISTSNGAVNDADCDRTPDPVDNCPLTTNPDQVDSDHNGIGDACDLVIEEVTVEPETPMQGRSMVVNIALINNRAYPMRNLVVKAEAPALGVAQSEDVSLIAPGDRSRTELVMRVPDCAKPTFTDVAAIVEYPFAPGQKEVFSQAIKVPVVASGLCSADAGVDKTIVNILDVQDVDPVKGALYPFTVHNAQAESRAYVLGVSGLEPWGSAEIHPGSVIVVPAGESRDGALQVWAKEGATGKHTFTLTVQAKDDIKQVMLLATIPQQAPQDGLSASSEFLWSIIGFLGLLLLMGVVLILVKRVEKKR